MPGLVVHLVMCLTSDSGVTSLIPAMSHTFVEIDSRRVVVSYKRKYVHKVLVNRLVKLAQKKVWSGKLTVPT